MITNPHERQLAVSAVQAERLIGGLAGHHDRLWPSEQWSALLLDKPLRVGARGHGPIRYRVEEYSPGERVRFRFEHPAGFDGYREWGAYVRLLQRLMHPKRPTPIVTNASDQCTPNSPRTVIA